MEYYGIFKRTESGIIKFAWRRASFPTDELALQLMKILIVKTEGGGNSAPYHIERLMCGKRVVYHG